jgi:hypothetical protein
VKNLDPRRDFEEAIRELAAALGIPESLSTAGNGRWATAAPAALGDPVDANRLRISSA